VGVEAEAGTRSVVPQLSLSEQGILQRFLDGRDLIWLDVAMDDSHRRSAIEYIRNGIE
jgi:hypothetical protein